jgi:hypothetical protein
VAQPPTDKSFHEYAGSFSGPHRAVPLNQQNQRYHLSPIYFFDGTTSQDPELVADSTDVQNLFQGIGGHVLSTEMRLAERDYQEFQLEHLPIPYNPGEIQMYDSELVLDSVEEQEGSSQYSKRPGFESFEFQPQNDATKRSQDQAPRHLNPQATNIARTPTTRRWSREYAPEERIRVGLPRWESKEARRKYERHQR